VEQVIRVYPIHMQKLRKVGNVKGRGKKHDGLQLLKKRGMKKIKNVGKHISLKKKNYIR